MEFFDFARAHGLVVNSLVPGKWVAVPTEDHPRKKNGRYKWLGDVGWVQNWATMEKPEIWRGNSDDAKLTSIKRDIENSNRNRFELAHRAAKKAAWILHQCKPGNHPYLEKKGFKDEIGNIWDGESGRLLVIPMRSGNRLIGCQLIDDVGAKKFLYGQITKGASFTLDAKGIDIFCEGYATALSIRAVLKSLKIRYTLHVCFSAGNLEFVAKTFKGGVIVADHDQNGIGEKAALKCDKPYWISPTVGEDFNDFHMRAGLFHATQSLRGVIFSSSSKIYSRSDESSHQTHQIS